MEIITLGELFDFISGTTKLPKTYKENGTVFFINYKDVLNSSVILKPKELISIFEHINYDKHNVEYDDLLITSTSETPKDVGIVSIYQGKEKTLLNGFCRIMRLKIKDKIIPKYAFYLLKTDLLRKQICNSSNGITRYNILWKSLKKISIKLVNLKYQQDIISIIEPFENLELLYQEKKNNLVNLLTSLYKHNSSSKKIKLLSFSKIINSKWKNQKYYVETKNINDNYQINGSLKKINIDTKPSRANLSVEKNSIIFSKLKGSIKLFPIFDEKYSKFVYSTGFFNIFSLLSNSYLFGFLNSDEFLEQKNANSTGTLMQGLNKKSLDNIYLYQPNKIYKLDIILILISKINILIKLINDIINNLINLFIL